MSSLKSKMPHGMKTVVLVLGVLATGCGDNRIAGVDVQRRVSSMADCTYWSERGFSSLQECQSLDVLIDYMMNYATTPECFMAAFRLQQRSANGDVYKWSNGWSQARLNVSKIDIAYTFFPITAAPGNTFGLTNKHTANDLFHEEYHIMQGRDHDPNLTIEEELQDEFYQFGNRCATEVFGS
jgi:hypothetical protein